MDYKKITIKARIKNDGVLLSNGILLYTDRGPIEKEIYTKYIFGRYNWEEKIATNLKDKAHNNFVSTHNENAIPALNISEELKEHLIKYIPIRKGDNVVEIGAYQGLGSVFISGRIGKTGKAICIEPTKIDFDYLVRNIKENKIDNTLCINKGLWNTNTQLTFYIQKGTQHRSFIKEVVNNNTTQYSMEVITLDSLLQKEKMTPSLIIMESTCYGEIHILQGMKNTLDQDKLRIVISLPLYKIDNTPADVVITKFLNSYGFIVKSGKTKLYAIKGY